MTLDSMRKYVWVALTLLAILVILAVLVVISNKTGNSLDPSSSLGEQKSQSDTGTRDSISNASSSDLIQPNSVATIPDTQDSLEVWIEVEIEEIEPDLVPEYKETVENAVLVELAQELWNCRRNDQIVIVVPQLNTTYTTTIEKVSTSLGNNSSYRGKLILGNERYSFLITVGESNVFANFGTPQGRYELVGNRKYAWLMPSANIDQHVDYDKPDFYIPSTDQSVH